MTPEQITQIVSDSGWILKYISDENSYIILVIQKHKNYVSMVLKNDVVTQYAGLRFNSQDPDEYLAELAKKLSNNDQNISSYKVCNGIFGKTLVEVIKEIDDELFLKYL